jgi:hypothetical protein
MESSMGFKSIIVSTFLLVSAGNAVSKTKELITLTRTDNNEKIQIKLKTDTNDDLEFIKVTSIKRTQKVPLEKIRRQSGATLLKRKGIKVARLQSDDLDKAFGGHVKFIYLKKFNIFSRNEYGAIRLRILKNKSGNWSLFHKSKQVKEIFVTPYRWGIKKVELK